MRYLLLFFILLNMVGAVALTGCGDDAGLSDLPYAYSIDATPDGVIESSAADSGRAP